MERIIKPSDYMWINKYPSHGRVLIGDTYQSIKRIFDLVIVILTIPLWLIIILLIALGITISSPGGPVIFTQCRTGKGGRRFWMYKFRTMVADAEEQKEKYAHLNELQWPDFKISDDPRVTPLGRLLRKTSLDELPQIINVLRGEMSFVGPRPTSFGPETYKLWQTERLDVVPGITGLWQIYGRGSTEFDDRLRLDIAYIERCNMWLDINILLRTITSIFLPRGVL
jgi:lipopolysaccharide/colanic/teichoic acid biosynthesis glycosyltransferase